MMMVSQITNACPYLNTFGPWDSANVWKERRFECKTDYLMPTLVRLSGLSVRTLSHFQSSALILSHTVSHSKSYFSLHWWCNWNWGNMLNKVCTCYFEPGCVQSLLLFSLSPYVHTCIDPQNSHTLSFLLLLLIPTHSLIPPPTFPSTQPTSPMRV